MAKCLSKFKVFAKKCVVMRQLVKIWGNEYNFSIWYAGHRSENLCCFVQNTIALKLISSVSYNCISSVWNTPIYFNFFAPSPTYSILDDFLSWLSTVQYVSSPVHFCASILIQQICNLPCTSLQKPAWQNCTFKQYFHFLALLPTSCLCCLNIY